MHLTISTPNKIYLNSFRPLCATELGRQAIDKYKYPPFIDGSCRREPDFENEFPTVSAICRQGHFAPRLRVNDIVIYMTVKRKYFSEREASNKLVAILQVTEIFSTHIEGYNWYHQNNRDDIPKNCMVDSNPPLKFDHSSGDFSQVRHLKSFLSKDSVQQMAIGARRLEHWDNSYRQKANTWPIFIKTKAIFKEYHSPASLLKFNLIEVFGNNGINTQNPRSISIDQLEKLASFADIKIIVE